MSPWPKKYKLKAVIPFEQRFWAKVDKTGDCWLWTASVITGGYGIIGRGRGGQGMEYSHRASWQIHFGPIPDGMLVCHKCDNRRCVRPDHLFLGTYLDNNRDSKAKGRNQHGSRHWNAKVTPPDVVAIRSEYKAGSVGQRALARKYGLSQQQISNIVTGESWNQATA